MNILYKKIVSYVLLLATILPIFSVSAAQRTPTWVDENAVGVTPDWHYRIPITIPVTAGVNSTVVANIDFAAMLTQLGIAGTFDVNSPRVRRPDGTLVAIQEFNNNIYLNATNAITTRGELRFHNQDAGGAIYYVYFDITQNGVKPVNPQPKINGRFEQLGATGQTSPTAWNAPTVTTGYDAQLRPSENPSIATDGGVVGNGASPRVVDGTPLTGAYSYLMGARTVNEGSTANPSTTFTKTITVPSVNPGNLVFKYRIHGWDSGRNGSATQYDNFNALLVGTTTVTMVGPLANNYTTYPFSPNYGAAVAANNTSGYGQYNGFDFDTGNTHRPQAPNLAMTVIKGSEPWWTVTQNLTAFAGQTITLRFTTVNTTLFKTWVHIDDVEWSVITPTVGNPEAFGVRITSPVAGFDFIAGQILSITAIVDANPGAFVFANIYDNNGVLVATNIRLYNDGTRGSNATTPNIWTNNGSDNTSPTYLIPSSTVGSNNWRIRVFAKDLSTSVIGSQNGLAKIVGQPNVEIEANYFNIAEVLFDVVSVFNTPGINVKSVSIISDPFNGNVNPKAIPGAEVMYTINITNTSSGAPDSNTIAVRDLIPTNTKMCLLDVAGPGAGPVGFMQGANPSGLTYTFVSLASMTDDLSFSNDNETTYIYVPVADVQGCDSSITHIRINPKGIMNVNTASPPSFALQFKVRIK